MITLTESAVKKVQEFFKNEPDAKGKSLRVALEAGGCSGFQYAFAFDVKQPDDNEIACEGFSVLVDPQSAQFLKGSNIDYVEDTAGSGFKIANPNVKKSCGCGQSNQF
jgi:iron-sulfur cluster assembly protein